MSKIRPGAVGLERLQRAVESSRRTRNPRTSPLQAGENLSSVSETRIAESVADAQLVDTKTMADLLDVSCSWLEKLRVAGAGPPIVRLGRSVRYNVVAVLKWAEAQTRMSTSEGKAA